MISSTPVRRSFIKGKEDQISCTPIESTVDDERRKRRSFYNVEHKLSNIPESPLISANFEQIKSQITMCQKLFNENKINIHNAWNMKVIDYMGPYLNKNEIDSEVMLVGARTLEVCVKVYGCKVDFLSQEVVKLASSMESAKNKNKDVAVDNESPEDEIVKENTKTKRKKRPLRSTILKDKPEMLTAEVPKLASVDFVGNVCIDGSSFNNMAINQIPMDHTLCKFHLSNNVDRGFVSYDMQDSINNEEFKITFPNVKPFVICPSFKKFNVDEDDNDYNDSIASAMNISKTQSIIGGGVAYDDDGIPIPEIDGSMHDIFADNDNALESIIDEVDGAHGLINKKKVEMITSFCPSQNNNVSTSNSFMETVWVGPSHWKNKLLRPSAPRFSGKPDNRVSHTTKRKTDTKKDRKTLSLNFDGVVETASLQKLKTKRPTNKFKKYTLPPNEIVIEYDKLMLSNIVPRRQCAQDQVESEFEHSPYDYNNADDSQYCSQADLLDTSDHQEAVNANDELTDNNTPALCSDNDGVPPAENASLDLIDAPEVVTQIYCPYALRAKNVNMKKLKSAMLSCLTKINESISNDAAEKEIHIQPTTFSEVFKQLPSKLPSKQRSGLSPALAFFSLLHLTNEHNLQLTECEGYGDIKIAKS